MNLPFTKKSPNLEGLKFHITFLWCPYPLTAFEGIYKLPPGNVLIYEDGEVKIFPFFTPSIDEGKVEKEEILEALKESVKKHLISDVEVGIFLSGGIDSSAIAALTEKPLRAFSLIFKEKDIKRDIFFQEYEYAKEVADKFGHKIYPVEVEFREGSLKV